MQILNYIVNYIILNIEVITHLNFIELFFSFLYYFYYYIRKKIYLDLHIININK